MKKKTVYFIVIGLCTVILIGFLAFALIWNGVILLNNPSRTKYPVRGVDVSHYQGEIDWNVLAEQDVLFAFIKATEGSTYIDEYFDYNYTSAKESGITVGAYHFFSYDSKGITQAENFIANVEPFEGMLPPVIDLEFYGDKAKNPPERETVSKELNDMLLALEGYYGLKPIIYATEASYDLYLSGDYGEYDIWIRNVIAKPKLPDGREWTFWQYTNREILEGYSGEERFIDINVFCGSKDEFDNYPRYSENE
ncbi:MAG: glycoside hydrolase family 25 protein [Oscillospiraceae bacterium]|nr:glycoside hydrolase family 25 protein [Oscillospiraceae bacterium]MBQ8624529.1 glycoside hydrolase family 25 protein [Oscillospiraceae bacterium]